MYKFKIKNIICKGLYEVDLDDDWQLNHLVDIEELTLDIQELIQEILIEKPIIKIPKPKACIHCIKKDNCKELNKRIKGGKKEHKKEIDNKDMDAYITFPLVMHGGCDDFKEE